jgi:hypothetical protein
MATREQIIAGLEMTVHQAKRTTALFDANEWNTKRPVGWTPKEIYAHLAYVAGVVPASLDMFFQATEDHVLFQDLNVDQMNAGAVATADSKTPQQVIEEFETNFRNLIDLAESFSDDQLNVKRRFITPEPRLASDIFAVEFALHGLQHVCEAATP